MTSLFYFLNLLLGILLFLFPINDFIRCNTPIADMINLSKVSLYKPIKKPTRENRKRNEIQY